MSFVNKPLTDIMDCTRASTATYVDATGKIRTAGVNEPRIDYSSGQGRLLVEESRTRLNTIAAAPTSPETITAPAVAHTVSFYGTGSVALSGTHTATLTGTGLNQRVTLTFTPTSGGLTLTPSGTVTDLQLEAGVTASSVIRGEASAVTRAADNVSRVLGDEFNKSEWTVFVDFDFKYGTVGTRHIFALSESDSSSAAPRSSIRIGDSTGGWVWQLISDDNSVLLSTNAGLPNFNQGKNKLCYSYKNGAAVLSLNGQATVLTPAFTDKTFNNLTKFWITSSNPASNYSVIDTRIYPKYLPESECIQLTKV